MISEKLRCELASVVANFLFEHGFYGNLSQVPTFGPRSPGDFIIGCIFRKKGDAFYFGFLSQYVSSLTNPEIWSLQNHQESGPPQLIFGIDDQGELEMRFEYYVDGDAQIAFRESLIEERLYNYCLQLMKKSIQLYSA